MVRCGYIKIFAEFVKWKCQACSSRIPKQRGLS